MDRSGNVRTALVTGGAKRIGRAIALALARERFAVAIHCNRSLDDAEKTASQIRALGGKAIVLQADFSDVQALDRIRDSLVREFGGLDLLVNNASAYPNPELVHSIGGLLTESPELFDRMFAVNAKAPFFLLQKFAPLLCASRDGQIVNILDRAGREPHLSRAAYSMSRAAAGLLSVIARGSLKGVRVNDVELGWVLPGDEMSDEEKSKRRWIGADAVAEAVLELVLDETVDGRKILLG